MITDSEPEIPSAVQAEEALLGCVLKAPSLLNDLSESLPEEDFFTPHHRAAYGSMLRLHDRGESVNLVSVSDEAKGAGGVSILSLSALPVNFLSAHAASFVKRIRETATKRRFISAAQEISDLAWRPTTLLPDLEAKADALIEGAKSAIRGASTMWTAESLAQDFVERMERREENTLPGITTGLQALDRITLGLQAGRLYLVPARPGLGKSVFMWQVSLHVAKTRPVLVATVEMTGQELTDRAIAAISGVDPKRMAMKTLTASENQAIARAVTEFAQLHLTVNDEDHTVKAIRSKALWLQSQVGTLGLIAVDYGQLLKDRLSTQSGRDENQGHVSGALKELAKEMKVPLLVPLQLNRKVEERLSNHVPQLSDIRDSGNWEQDADVVVTPFREDYYDPEKKPGEAMLVVLKNRHEGLPAGTVREMFWRDGKYVDYRPAPMPSYVMA